MSDAKPPEAAATPEQVLAAGGASKRRRGISSSGDGKRRSPSSQRRRVLTSDGEGDDKKAPPRRSSKEKRSLSSPGGDRQKTEDEEEVKAEKIVAVVGADVAGDKIVSVVSGGTVKKALKKASSVEEKKGERTVKDSKVEQYVITGNGGDKKIVTVEKVEMQSTSTRLPVILGKKGDVTEVESDEVQAVVTEIVTEKVVSKVEEVPKYEKKVIGKAEEDPKAADKQEDLKSDEEETVLVEQTPPVTPSAAAIWGPFLGQCRKEWTSFQSDHGKERRVIVAQRNRCLAALLIVLVYCGVGGLVFRFTEGAFEAFYKCGVKRVKRDFIDSLWMGSHHLLEDDWKSQARRKLMDFENQLHAAHDAGVTSYSGQRAWSFLNAVVYAITIVTTIGYGHVTPSTATGRAITVVYAMVGIPLFLIVLTEMGKLLTRVLKLWWAFGCRVGATESGGQLWRSLPIHKAGRALRKGVAYVTFQSREEPPEPLESPTPPSPCPVDDEFDFPVWAAVSVLVVYLLVGALGFWCVESWGVFEAFYFVFISTSTIGFGDLVPAHPLCMMASIVYMSFGLALTSMVINVVQERLTGGFWQMCTRLATTLGLKVTEESLEPEPGPEKEHAA